MAPIRELDTVELVRDVPEVGLRAGDLGAVVQVYPPDAFGVEFVTVAGHTAALQTLASADVRWVRDDNLLAVPPDRSAPRRRLTNHRALHCDEIGGSEGARSGLGPDTLTGRPALPLTRPGPCRPTCHV